MTAIVTGEIKWFKSTQTGSTGGAITATEVTPSTLWDTVNSTESASGDTEYRCIFVKNTNASNSLTSPKFWVVTDGNPTDLEIGIDPAGKNASAATPADEGTAPAGVTFYSAAAKNSKANGIALPDLAPGDYHAVWLKRIVAPSTAAASDSHAFRVEGDTLAA